MMRPDIRISPRSEGTSKLFDSSQVNNVADDNAKVLVIEPNHDSQSEFQLILENEFFVPVVADTSREASVNAAFKDIKRLLLRFDAPQTREDNGLENTESDGYRSAVDCSKR